MRTHVDPGTERSGPSPRSRESGRRALAEADEASLVTRLRQGDDAAFTQLVDRYYAMTLRVARSYVRSYAVAEEVAQDAWIGVIEGLQGFEGRSSLKTWVVRIVVNRARTRAVREARSLPFSALVREDEDGIDRGRFRASGDAFPGHWISYPASWRTLPDEALAMRETLAVLREAIDHLPEMQRLVLTLRDVEGWESAEIAAALDLNGTNERVLLHRARTKVRAALEGHLAG